MKFLIMNWQLFQKYLYHHISHLKIQMIYGYAVCLVVVITFIISLTSIVNAVIDLTDPLNSFPSYWSQDASLASFENYKVSIITNLDPDHELELDDATLKSMYDTAKESNIAKVRHTSIRKIIVNGIVLIISVTLFVIHWMWMRRLSKKAG